MSRSSDADREALAIKAIARAFDRNDTNLLRVAAGLAADAITALDDPYPDHDRRADAARLRGIAALLAQANSVRQFLSE